MNDVMLYARLKDLGMPADQAWNLAARIRDTLHPVAAVAASQLHDYTGLRGTACGCGMGGLGSDMHRGVRYGMQGASAGAKAGSVVPVVGTAIGAVIGAVVGLLVGGVFGPAKIGKAAETWNDMAAHGYLNQTPGRAFDERYFGEALKGAMDEGNNVWRGCGKDRHKDPDCFFGPMSQVIAQGYLNRTVPLNASTDDVYNRVVLPWLKGPAGINWGTLANEPTQQMLLKAATDRYINGLPITRADMPAYKGQGYTRSYPSLNQALQSLTTATNQPPRNVSAVIANAPVAQVPTPIVNAATQVAQQLMQAGGVPNLSVGGANISAPQQLYQQNLPAGPAPQVPIYAPTPYADANGVPAYPLQAMPSYQALSPQQDTTAGIMRQMISADGANFNSQPAQQLLADVAANGVEKTPHGPNTAGATVSNPMLIGIAGLMAVSFALARPAPRGRRKSR